MIDFVLNPFVDPHSIVVYVVQIIILSIFANCYILLILEISPVLMFLAYNFTSLSLKLPLDSNLYYEPICNLRRKSPLSCDARKQQSRNKTATKN